MPDNFSLVDGGPFDRLLNQLGLTTPLRRAVALALVTWGGLFVITCVRSVATGGASLRMLLLDYPSYARFLVAVPLFILADIAVGIRTAAVVKYMRDSGVVDAGDLTNLGFASEVAVRAARSVLVEVAVLVLAYASSVAVLGFVPHVAGPSMGQQAGGLINSFSPAIWWYGLVSLPIFNFLFYRWILRLLIWARFLWRVSRLRLRLIATHPDLAGGLGFLPIGQIAYWPVVFAAGCVVSAILAQRIVLNLETLSSFAGLIGVYVLVSILIVIGPLLVFTPELIKTKVAGLIEYGRLAGTYTQRFDRKWVSAPEPEEELLGTSDIQSLADIGNGFEVVRNMRIAPFGASTVAAVAAAAAGPLVPLFFVQFGGTEAMTRLFKILF